MRIIAFCSKDIKSPWKRKRGVNYIFPRKNRNPAEELKRKHCPWEAGEQGWLREICSSPIGQPPVLWLGGAGRGIDSCTGDKLGQLKEIAGCWLW